MINYLAIITSANRLAPIVLRFLPIFVCITPLLFYRCISKLWTQTISYTSDCIRSEIEPRAISVGKILVRVNNRKRDRKEKILLIKDVNKHISLHLSLTLEKFSTFKKIISSNFCRFTKCSTCKYIA